MRLLRSLVGGHPHQHQPALATGALPSTPARPRWQHESHGPELVEAEVQIADLEARAKVYLSGGASNQRE